MSGEPDQPPATPQRPDERPVPGPAGPRTPYAVDRPPIDDLPGSEPDVVPGKPADPKTM